MKVKLGGVLISVERKPLWRDNIWEPDTEKPGVLAKELRGTSLLSNLGTWFLV